MVVDFRLNGKATGSTIKTNKAPNLKIKAKGQRELEKIEVVRNSEVIKEYKLKNVAIEFEKNFTDEKYKEENEVLQCDKKRTDSDVRAGSMSPNTANSYTVRSNTKGDVYHDYSPTTQAVKNMKPLPPFGVRDNPIDAKPTKVFFTNK